ncbi:MAG: TetR/AcrR family transcriptional regulator [Burkholderiaceae bacterium]
MARIAGKITEQTVRDMQRAATRLIALHGFEGMNLRMLADEIGVKAGSFYNHIESKEQLLHTLLRDTMRELMAGIDAALAGAAGPADALRRFVAFHIEFHAVRRDQVFIGNAELRSLSAAHRREIVALRDAYEQRLAAILRAGERTGVFAPGDVRVATYALIAMLSGVCTWYRAGGRLSVNWCGSTRKPGGRCRRRHRRAPRAAGAPRKVARATRAAAGRAGSRARRRR